MKIKFVVPIYEFDLVVVVRPSKKELSNLVEWVDGDADGVLDGYESRINEGWAWTNGDYKRGLVAVTKCNDNKETYKVLRHELRHVEDRILEIHRVKDIESAALLSEYISGKLFDLITKITRDEKVEEKLD